MSVVKLRIGPADHGRPMTLDELLEAEEEPGYRYEHAIHEQIRGPIERLGGRIDDLELCIVHHGYVAEPFWSAAWRFASVSA